MSPEKIIEIIFDNYSIPVDVGRTIFTSLNDKNVKLETYFLNTSSFGHSPSIQEEELYDLNIANQNIVKFRIETEESKHSMLTYFTCIQNGKFFADGLEVSSKSSIQDGMFDIYMSGDIKKWDYKKFKKDKIELFKCQNFSVTSQTDLNILVECDGEIVGKLPAKWTMLPKEVRMIVPKNWSTL
jgi:diacylglycerol kinase (ATP)